MSEQIVVFSDFNVFHVVPENDEYFGNNYWLLFITIIIITKSNVSKEKKMFN